MPAVIGRAFERHTERDNVVIYPHTHRLMENVHVPHKEILPPPSAPSPQFRLPGSSWALLLLQSPTASNSLPSAPSKEVLINALHFAASQALIARRIMISFFLVVSKQSGGQRALPVQTPPSPAAAGQRGGSKVPNSP